MRSYPERQQPARSFIIPAWAFAVIACCLAAVLSLLFLDAKSFWLDEAESVNFADPSRHLGQVGLADGGNFALYYLLLHVWLRFGSSDAYVRILSVIPAVIAVACIYILGRRLFGTRAGTIAAFALALNPFFIAYAQEARGYSLLLLLSIISTLFFVRLVQQRGSRLDVLLYVIASVLMVYTHLLGIFVLAAHAVALLFFDKHLVPWRTIALAAVSIAVLLVPLAYFAYRHGAAGIAWIPPLSAGTVFEFLKTFAGGFPLLILYILLAGYAVAEAFRARASHASSEVASLGLVFAWLIVPIALTAIFSILITPMFVPRYLIVTLAPLTLFAGAVLGRIRGPVLLATVGIVFVVLSTRALWHYYLYEPKDDWRGVAAYVLSHSQSGDIVFCNPPWTVVPLRHAIDRLRRVEPSPLLVERTPLNSNRTLNPHSPEIRAFLDNLTSHPRVWLIVSTRHGLAHGFQNNLSAQASIIEDTLKQHKRLSVERSFVAIDARLYSERQ
jgi:mannosyltransferase